MKTIRKTIRKVLSFTLKKPYRVFKFQYNKRGKKKQCYVCKETFHRFTKFKGGSGKGASWNKKFDVVGSDVDNFGCMYCGSNDRERHLFMYFDKLDIWPKFKNAEIIHFAPETILSRKIMEYKPSNYVKADLYPLEDTVSKIDITNIPFKNDSFQILICNHVLEHVPDYLKAFQEIYRVLKPGGLAILQTPYSRLLQKNFEDEGINTDELRLFYYGQEDHVRHFSEKQMFQDLADTGFELRIHGHRDLFEEGTARYFGVNEKEKLIYVVKPDTKKTA